MKKIKFLFYIFILPFLISGNKAFAEQTILTVPSSEVLPFKQIMLKESNRFNPFHPDEYVTLTPSITVGTGYNTELTAGVATAISDDTKVRADLGAKKVFFITGANRLTVGARLNPYLTETSTPETYTYAHLSTRIRKTRTTLTAGMYVAGDEDFLPSKPGVILGLEQNIIPNKLRLAMEWTSRNESFGLLGVGLKYKIVPTATLTSGILIPNGNRGQLAFQVSFSKYIALNR